MVDRRGLIAAVLGFVYPGLGHVYLRKWVRALAWFLLAIATAALVVPPSAYEAFQTGGVQGLLEASESFGPTVTLSLFAVRVLNVADAYLVAVRERAADAATVVDGVTGAAGGETPTCPSCGKELDEDLDFCPWCTQRLDAEPADAESS
ncbi:MAG: zinc ribbon domain-containing protein [Halobacterium sp.]